METKHGIASKFYKGHKHPKAKTIGKLKKILEQLPDDLEVRGDWSKSIQVVVYNISSDKHVLFQDAED